MKYIFILIMCCMSLSVCNAQHEKTGLTKSFKPGEEEKIIKNIKKLYTAHMSNEYTANSVDSIDKVYLTKEMIAKLQRINYATGVNAIIRAQDYQDDSYKTLTVNHLDKNWYMVGYKYINENGTTFVNIPLRVIKKDNQYKIDYITPSWNGTLYGDSILIDNPIIKPIDISSPLLLLKTFYNAYTTEYCSMPENLAYRLKELRIKYCTKKALNDFKAAGEKASTDGYPGFDLFINGFDFDKLWINSLSFRHISGEEYEVSYQKNGTPDIILLNIVKIENEFRIDGIKANILY